MSFRIRPLFFLIYNVALVIFCTQGYAQELPTIEFISLLREGNQNSKIESKVIPTSQSVYFCYEIQGINDTIIIPSNYVYFEKNRVVDLPKEGFIRFVDPNTNQVGLYNSKAQVALDADFKDLSQVKNNLVVTLSEHEQDSYVKAIGDVFGEVALKPTYFSNLVSLSGDVLIEDFNYSMSLDLYSLVLDDMPLESPLYVSFKANDGKWYNFIDRVAYFKDFFLNVFQESLKENSFCKYLQDNTMVSIGMHNVLLDHNEVQQITYDSLEAKDLERLDWLWNYLQNTSGFKLNLFKAAYRYDLSFLKDEFYEQQSYVDQNGMWDVDLYPVWTLFVEEKFPGGYKLHAVDFYRDSNNQIKISRISLSDKKHYSKYQ